MREENVTDILDDVLALVKGIDSKLTGGERHV